MSFLVSAYAVPYYVATIIAFICATILWSRQSKPGAKWMAMLLVCIFIWAIGNNLELAYASLSDKIFWANIEYFSIVAIPVLWLYSTMDYAGHQKRLRWPFFAATLIIPAITFALVWTNPWHGLMRRNISLDSSGPFSVIIKEYGPWFWVHALYSYTVSLAGSMILIITFIREPKLYHPQTLLMLAGATLPYLSSILFIFGIWPFPKLDITPLAFAISGLLLTIALFRYHLYDLVPQARDTVIESMSDGFLVLDTSLRVVDANRAAAETFQVPAEKITGKQIKELLPQYMNIAESVTQNDVTTIISFPAKTEPDIRYYSVRMSRIYDKNKKLTGWVLVAREITESYQAAAERDRLINKLEEALANVTKLEGLIPICASCKRIRDDSGYWKQVEEYVSEHSDAEFSHSICPDCLKKLYPDEVI